MKVTYQSNLRDDKSYSHTEWIDSVGITHSVFIDYVAGLLTYYRQWGEIKLGEYRAISVEVTRRLSLLPISRYKGQQNIWPD